MNFPKFGQNDPAIGFVFHSEKSKSRQGYERAHALAAGFIRAGAVRGPATRFSSAVAVAAFLRLLGRLDA